jgi:hypothetical protein
MRKFLVSSALAVTLLSAASLSFASDEFRRRPDVPRDNWLTIQQIIEKVSAQGYDIRSIEMERRGYEVEAIDKSGRRVEADVDPLTGEILRKKWDDD